MEPVSVIFLRKWKMSGNVSTRPKTISDWKVVPSSDGIVAMMGIVEGRQVQTSPICYGRQGEVKSENSHYILGDKLPGVWEIQLEMCRPEKAGSLRRLGVL
jgi:hypothetical protein